jgi:hypothetical protein
MRAEQPPPTDSRSYTMKNEIAFAADLLTSVIPTHDDKAIQSALVFSLGVLFAADKQTPFEEKAGELTDLGVILRAPSYLLAGIAEEVRNKLTSMLA